MTDWFRSWHGAPTDIKWLVIARQADVLPGIVSTVVWALLDCASQAEDRGSVAGFDIESYAAFSGFEEATILAVIRALQAKQVITHDQRLAQWEKRQPAREDMSAADRARTYRERKKLNGSEPPSGTDPAAERPTKSSRTTTHRHAASHNVTHHHTPSRPREEQSRTEKNRESRGRRPLPPRVHARDVGADAPREGAHAPKARSEYSNLVERIFGRDSEHIEDSLVASFPGGLPEAIHMMRIASRKSSPIAWLSTVLRRRPPRVAENAFVAAFDELRQWNETYVDPIGEDEEEGLGNQPGAAACLQLPSPVRH